MSESKPSEDASKILRRLPKLGAADISRTSRGETCLRTRRQPVYRRHDLNSGFGMERENLVSDAKGNDKWQTPRGRIPKPERGAELPVVVLKPL